MLTLNAVVGDEMMSLALPRCNQNCNGGSAVISTHQRGTLQKQTAKARQRISKFSPLGVRSARGATRSMQNLISIIMFV